MKIDKILVVLLGMSFLIATGITYYNTVYTQNFEVIDTELISEPEEENLE